VNRLLTLAIVMVLLCAASLAVYHMLFHAQDGETEGGPAARPAAEGPEAEVREIEHLLERSRAVVPVAYDEAALRALAANAKADLTAEQEAVVLPLLHEHLLALLRNLEEALEAARRGDADRARFRVVATRRHDEFQRRLREHLPAEQARALFGVAPAMVPPPPRRGP
jgi:hypothetical protein